MKLDRAAHEPGELLEFYEQGLGTLGALCERTWHDRLEVLAEGRAAALWNPAGAMHEVELHFAPADATVARDAAREVFPGCPLTFQLAEALRGSELALERFVLADDGQAGRPPDAAVAEKRWRAQFAETGRWQLDGPFTAGYHFTLLALARCEIQAIDQHWSLHRLAVSLPGGGGDDDLAREIAFRGTNNQPLLPAEILWPSPDPAVWKSFLQRSIEAELTADLARIRARQEHSLRRELERIDDYFAGYAKELNARAHRSSSEATKLKSADRLAAAKAEHARRRADQVARHEIRILPHVDALVLVAEKAWQTRVRTDRARQTEVIDAQYIPRARRWDALGVQGKA